MMTAEIMNRDPLAGKKGLIRDMISELEQATSHKAYCDKEICGTSVKHEDKSAEIEKLTTSTDERLAQSAKLKVEIATFRKRVGADSFVASPDGLAAREGTRRLRCE